MSVGSVALATTLTSYTLIKWPPYILLSNIIYMELTVVPLYTSKSNRKLCDSIILIILIYTRLLQNFA